MLAAKRHYKRLNHLFTPTVLNAASGVSYTIPSLSHRSLRRQGSVERRLERHPSHVGFYHGLTQTQVFSLQEAVFHACTVRYGKQKKREGTCIEEAKRRTSDAHDTATEEVRIVKPDWNRSNRLSKLATEWQVDLYMEKILEIPRARRQVFERTDVSKEEEIFDVDDEEQNQEDDEEQNQEEDEEKREPIQSVPQQGQGNVSKVLQHPIGFGR
ncbi:hypothetical protein L1987_16776 [Smallanthus sonchifolius]|uniref:Uncharacterized protein n=1 Tax=Smallanthus sonchifolius TaxID=185202 RepID=A0ACB9IW50_9ASTR|nr:hypothetical protein L1987_16776 [Smallanthus sonchifolius]